MDGTRKGWVSSEVGDCTPKPVTPLDLTYCSHGLLQLVQPVPQPARGLVSGIHLRGERRSKEQPPARPRSWQGARGGTHTAQHIRTGLVEELEGLPAHLSKAGFGGELQHGYGEVQLGHHQQHSVGHLGAASVLVSDPEDRGWRMGGSSLPEVWVEVEPAVRRGVPPFYSITSLLPAGLLRSISDGRAWCCICGCSPASINQERD